LLVVKAPLRVSLFGGGTDIPEYYSKHGSLIISFALNCSIYLIHNPRPTGGYRLSYSKVEELDDLLKAEHTIIRAAERLYRFGSPCTFSIVSDVPKGTGLGSSSALSVALTQLARPKFRPLELLESAYHLERQVSPVGIQDFLPAIFGGFNVYNISTNRHIQVEPAPHYLTKIIQQYGMLLYTGIDRNASHILKRMPKSNKELSRIHSVAELARDKLGYFNHITLAEALTATWRHKRQISGVTSARLDDQFRAALKAGAHGGKLCGAGGGGCWFLIVSPGDRQKVKEATELTEIPFKVGKRIEQYCL
jgi:D-glycero-alpha-D-manno-heptose-7-phosphate kinase